MRAAVRLVLAALLLPPAALLLILLLYVYLLNCGMYWLAEQVDGRRNLTHFKDWLRRYLDDF